MGKDKKYDIGIVGWWYNLNYGGTLTYFALNKTLRDLGYSVLMIQRSCPPTYKPNLDTVPRRFADKHYTISERYTYDKLNELNELCESFIVGSDQLWNPHLMQYSGPEFFLSFANDDKKKIAYATSFGNVEKCDPAFIKKYSPYLHRFDHISVRENYSVDMCKSDFSIDVSHVCDPIFLCDKSHFEKIALDSKLESPKRYVVNYLLDPNADKIKAVRHIRNRLNVSDYLNFTDLQDIDNRKKAFDGEGVFINAEIEDLVKAYRDADFIVTDSFHGTCLAIIFNKPFISFANKDRGDKRFYSLVENLFLSERLLSDINEIYKDDILLKPMNYDLTNEALKLQRERGMRWLKNALSSQKKQTTDSHSSIEHKDVTHYLNLSNCTGCGACASACPVNAIHLEPDLEGFLKPVVTEEKCTNCGVCEKKCVALHPTYQNSTSPKCYAMMADDDTRSISSSGGMFSVLAKHILKKKGFVCGAAFRDDFSVEHIIVDSEHDLYKLRGSKYIQSDASHIYPKIKKLISDHKIVLFTGLPCQVAGLYAFLGKRFENLITVDLLCHGITSYKVFKKYHHDIHGDKQLQELYFKAKKPWGWHAGVNAHFADGSKYSKPLEHDSYFKAYLNSISKGTACSSCKQNKLPRQGDLSIGDFWGIKNFNMNLNDGKGTSVVLINNQIGQTIFDECRIEMKLAQEAPLNIAIGGNHCIEHPYPLHKNRDRFFKNLAELHFAQLTDASLNNRIYEQEYLHLVKQVPKEDLEFYYIAKTVFENFKGRKVVTWIRSSRFEKILKKYFNIDVHIGISMRNEALKTGYIEHFDILKGKQSEYYLISLDRAYDEGVYKTLQEYGYAETRDFVFRRFKPVILERYDLSKGNYYDKYGNTVEGFGAVVGKIILRGFNNHIMLGKNIPTAHNLHFDLGANSIVDIGDNAQFHDKTFVNIMTFNNTSTLIIGSKCILSGGGRFRYPSGPTPLFVIINPGCTFSSFVNVSCNQGSRIVVGEDCMFSFDICMQAGDGHSIFDVKTKKNININFSDSHNQKNLLVLGNHVWIGKQAVLLHGTNIGDGSIIGAQSVTTKSFPNNCVVAGNPSKLVKTDVAWSRDGVAEQIPNSMNANYAHTTSIAKPPIAGKKVLVVGGTRFMGKQLVRRLLELGNDVTIATRGATPDPFRMRIDRIRMDLSDYDSVRKVLHGQYFDVIFDNLAYCSLYVKNLLENVKCGKYIQLSSVEAYRTMQFDMKETWFNPLSFTPEVFDIKAGYVTGKRSAEIMAYSMLGNLVTTVRIPYVTKTDRLLYYCRHIMNQTPMNVDDTARGFTFIRDTEVGSFLPWIAGQAFHGPINLASEGMVTIQMILEYIEQKLGKPSIVDTTTGAESPFHVYGETTFSLNMDTAKRLGYHTSNLHDWFWVLMDEYIRRVAGR